MNEIKFVAQRDDIRLDQIVSCVIKAYSRSAARELIKKGLVKVKRTKQERDPLRGLVFPEDKPLILTDAQNHAVDSIIRSFDSHNNMPKSFLLKGVTGSGKTEVYMQAIADCIRRGKRCLFLVPEISLTPQMIERLSARFSGKLGLMQLPVEMETPRGRLLQRQKSVPTRRTAWRTPYARNMPRRPHANAV